MLSQTQVFVHLVRDHMHTVPAFCSSQATCAEVVALFQHADVSNVVVNSDDGLPVGIVTEQDVCRRIAFMLDPQTPISESMSAPVLVIRDDDYLYHGVAEMRRRELRHMPVVNRHGAVVGVLNLDAALTAAASQIVGQIDRISHGATLDGLVATKQAQTDMALELFDDTVPAPEIQWLLSRINMDLHRRVVGLCREAMIAEGYGDAPVDFDVIIMGSGGRGESYLTPDQDNGFVLDEYADDEHERVDAWFLELAKRMTEMLAEVGFELCKGDVMATNSRWRKRLGEYREQTWGWISRARGNALRYCDIFFDFQHCYGDGELTRRLREYVTEHARRPHFLRQLYRVDKKHRGALGMFHRLLTDPNEGPNQGKIDLKVAGTLPLVGAVRLAALRDGISVTSTRERIALLQRSAVIDENEADYLGGALEHITNLLLRQQLADRKADRDVGNHVPPDALTDRDKDRLVDAFRAIRAFHSRLGRLVGD